MRNILIFIPGYLPGFKSGGPVRTIANQINALAKEFNFHVVCGDRDLGDSGPYLGIDHSRWNVQGRAKVFYLNQGRSGLDEIGKILSEPHFQVLYLNSFFSFRFSIYPLLVVRKRRPALRVIVGPRGEFSAGALAIKARKKKIYLAFAKLLGLYSGVLWHASTDFEKADIERVMGRAAKVRVAIDIAKPANVLLERIPKEDGSLRIVFISRITPIKNLKTALLVLNEVKASVMLDIYGPLEDKCYWDECQALIRTLPRNIETNYKGSLAPQEVVPTFSQYDVFLFPTHGENFGHVIAEAFFSGIPVLVSDQTPWRDLEKSGVGWDIPLSSLSAFSEKIDRLAAMNAQDYAALRNHVQQWAFRTIGGDDAVLENKSLFMS